MYNIVLVSDVQLHIFFPLIFPIFLVSISFMSPLFFVCVPF